MGVGTKDEKAWKESRDEEDWSNSKTGRRNKTRGCQTAEGGC